MRTTFNLSTVNLQINGNNENGYSNATRTSLIFKNLNFRILLGRLYDAYEKFNIKLLQVISNTALILNFNPTQPKIYLTMENYDATTVFNSGDFANYGNATLDGAVSISASNKVNGIYSCSFDNESGFLSLPAFSYPVTGGITYCYWIYSTGSSFRPHYNNNHYGVYSHSNGFLRIILFDGGTVISFTVDAFTRFVWHHVCITHAIDGTFKCYLNNVLIYNGNITYTTASGGDFYIGRSFNSYASFRGNIDDFRYYNTILTDEERGYIYTNIFPVDGDYDNQDSCISVNVGGLPFINRGNGKCPLALCQMEQSKNNNLISSPCTINKPNDIGEISIDLIDIQTNQLSTNLQSNMNFLFEVEGI